MLDGSNLSSLVKRKSPLDNMEAAEAFAQANGYTAKADDLGRPVIMRGNKIVGGTISTPRHEQFGSFDNS